MTEPVVPFLRKGAGNTPTEGGCIMQVIDWIDSGGWSDTPACVHPVLQHFGIEINDRVDDAQRQRLLDLAPRIMGTANPEGRLYYNDVGPNSALLTYVAEALVPHAHPFTKELLVAIAQEDSAARSETLMMLSAAFETASDDATMTMGRIARAFAGGSSMIWQEVIDDAEFYVWLLERAGVNLVDFLAGMLDVLDEHGHRTSDPVEEIDWTPVCQVMATA